MTAGQLIVGSPLSRGGDIMTKFEWVSLALSAANLIANIISILS